MHGEEYLTFTFFIPPILFVRSIRVTVLDSDVAECGRPLIIINMGFSTYESSLQ
jgi:hypothetical protein